MGAEVNSARSEPYGVAVRYAPPGGSAGFWHVVCDLPDGRLGVAVGHDEDPAAASRAGSRVAADLRASGDPVAALTAPAGSPDASALCAVIDRRAGDLTYGVVGEIGPLIAAPGVQPQQLKPPASEPGSTDLPAAATVLLCTAPGAGTGPVLGQCADLHPDEAAARIVGTLARRAGAAVALLYRHAPGPLMLTVPATPASLATIRSHLRHWLALTGVDPETAADTLLAVGEAAANATEHSVLGSRTTVKLTVRAALSGDRLRFTVVDNGCWKRPAENPGHRGHGIRLIRALVDEAELVTDEQGTTVEMVKELRK